MRTFDKLIKQCNEADVAQEQQERECARLAQKVSAYRGELKAATAAAQSHVRNAEEITQRAAEQAAGELRAAEEIETRIAGIKKRLASAENELAGVTVPQKRVSTIVPSVLGLR